MRIALLSIASILSCSSLLAAEQSAPASADKCAALLSWKQGDAVIETAEKVTAGTEVSFPMMMRKFVVPAHCLARGSIAKRTGADGKPYAIGFELRLPEKWNGRFLYQGGGGYDGMLFPALGSMTGGQLGLDRGFAVISTDAGHRDSMKPGTQGDFALDPQARKDFAYNALDRVATTGKAIVQQYYGSKINHSYFAGCSGGGRQAMLASQRFPEQFDGLVAGAPASRIADIGIGGLKRYQALVGKTPQELANLLSKEDLQLISDGIAKQCDALDGTSDGLIFNFKQCNFKPESLACKSGQTSGCLSADKLKWFDALVSAPKTSTGKEAYSAFPYDTAVSAPGWLMGLTIGLPGNTSQEAMRSVQLLYFTPHEARDFREITIDDALASTEEMRKLTNTRSTDLDAFRKHGSKILYYHGISDQIISANDTFQYYDALLEKYGPATQSFARFYPVPGFLHCFGGSGLTDFDMLGALVDWVEKGKAPDTIIAGNPQRPGETRPLCPYPSYARYSGKGDPKTAASYSCAK